MWSKLCILIQICCQSFISSLGTNLWEHLRLSCCLHMNFGTVYTTQNCQYVWCISNDYMQANGNIFHWSYRLGRFVRRMRILRSVFIACDQVRACVRTRSRACVREQNTEKFGLSSSLLPSLHLLPCFAFFALFFFLSRAVRRKRKKLESCCD